MSKTGWFTPLCMFLAFWPGAPVTADQVVMRDGDTYSGTVLSVTTNSITLQSPNLGTVTLPRAKAATIHLGTQPVTNTVAAPAVSQLRAPHSAAGQANAGADPAEALRGIRRQTNLVQQVQTEMLGGAGPEAAAKFNELLDGLSTGKMDMNGLRAEARSAAEQLRALKKELGPDGGGELDGYLAILESFLRQTPPANTGTNAPRPAPSAASDSGRTGR
jgi:hypothetical protein